MNVCRPVKRAPSLLQLDEQHQQTINKRRLVSSFGNNKTLNSYVQRTLTPITSLQGYHCLSVCNSNNNNNDDDNEIIIIHLYSVVTLDALEIIRTGNTR